MSDFYITSSKFSIRERKTKRGKVYDAIFRIVDKTDGSVRQKTLAGYSTKSAAKVAYNEFVEDYCEYIRKSPFAKKTRTADEPTIRELCYKYLIELKPYNKESVIYDKTNIYERYVYPLIGDKKPSQIDKKTLIEWQDELTQTKARGRENTLSAKYIHKIRGHLSAMFKWANDKYNFNMNFDGVRQTVIRKKKGMTFWTLDEFNKFIAVADDPRLKMFFSMLFYTGRRKGELFALSNNDVKPTEIKWYKSVTRKVLKDGSGKREPYKITSTKEDKVQTLPTAPELQKLIAEYKGEEPFYFGGDKPLAENTVTRKFKEYAERAGVQRIRIHDLRHSFASRLLKNGENVLVIAELIGDTPEQVIKTYCHINAADIKAAIDRF